MFLEHQSSHAAPYHSAPIACSQFRRAYMSHVTTDYLIELLTHCLVDISYFEHVVGASETQLPTKVKAKAILTSGLFGCSWGAKNAKKGHLLKWPLVVIAS